MLKVLGASLIWVRTSRSWTLDVSVVSPSSVLSRITVIRSGSGSDRVTAGHMTSRIRSGSAGQTLQLPVCLSVCRTMLTKDKKPEEKETRKEAAEVIPPRPDTPKLFKAALKVTERAGIEGTFAKMKKVYQPAEGQTEVGREGWREDENEGRREGGK